MLGEPALMKLRAEDEEDLQVISSLLQDALVPPGDLEFIGDRQCFVMAANRFRWEDAEDQGDSGQGNSGQGDPGRGNPERRGAPDERVLCGVAFENVTGVQRRGIDPHRRGGFYSLLSIELDRAAAGPAGPAIELIFSAGAGIRLETTKLLCILEDFGEPWPTRWRPQHH